MTSLAIKEERVLFLKHITHQWVHAFLNNSIKVKRSVDPFTSPN